MILTREDAINVVFGDHPDWTSVTNEEIVNRSRWSLIMLKICKHIPTQKHYRVLWSEGATEQQWEEPFEGQKEVEFVEVKPVEKVVIDWVPV